MSTVYKYGSAGSAHMQSYVPRTLHARVCGPDVSVLHVVLGEFLHAKGILGALIPRLKRTYPPP